MDGRKGGDRSHRASVYGPMMAGQIPSTCTGNGSPCATSATSLARAMQMWEDGDD